MKTNNKSHSYFVASNPHECRKRFDGKKRIAARCKLPQTRLRHSSESAQARFLRTRQTRGECYEKPGWTHRYFTSSEHFGAELRRSRATQRADHSGEHPIRFWGRRPILPGGPLLTGAQPALATRTAGF